MLPTIITIDGPRASGKSTLATRINKYLDLSGPTKIIDSTDFIQQQYDQHTSIDVIMLDYFSFYYQLLEETKSRQIVERSSLEMFSEMLTPELTLVRAEFFDHIQSYWQNLAQGRALKHIILDVNYDARLVRLKETKVKLDQKAHQTQREGFHAVLKYFTRKAWIDSNYIYVDTTALSEQEVYDRVLNFLLA